MAKKVFYNAYKAIRDYGKLFNSILMTFANFMICHHCFYRCPIMGCANKQFVKMSDLIEDEDIAFILAAQRRRAAQNK